MAISNDERRQVAARLREKHGERQGTFEPQSMSIQAMNRLDDLLECLPKRRDMFLDLADLIEPEPERTCEKEFDFPQEVGFKQIDCRCSECWHGMSVHDHYCAECGAKEVEQ